MNNQKRDLASAILWLVASVVWFTIGSQKNQPILVGVGGISIMVGMEYLKRWWNVWKEAKEKQEKERDAAAQKNKSEIVHKKKK